MEAGSGAWASTYFNPNLKVHISGLAIEQEDKFRQSTQESADEIIGEWISDFGVSGKITLLKKITKYI